MGAVVWPNFLNGFSGGFIFVPLTTLAMGRLRKEEMGNAAGIYNLVRNVGGSIGIAALTTAIVRGTQTHQNYLAAHLTASNPVPMAMIHGLTGKIRHGRRRRGAPRIARRWARYITACSSSRRFWLTRIISGCWAISR